MLGCRIPQELLDEVSRTIVRRNAWSPREPWTQASFIVAAIREKIAKMARSRSRKGRKIRRPATQIQNTPIPEVTNV